MSRPDLYRSGNTTSPRFDNVRVGTDITVDANNNVKPSERAQPLFLHGLTALVDSGGISTFSQKGDWGDTKTWVLQKTTQLGTGLVARNDRATHWSIEPATVMQLATYKGYLTQLNTRAVRYDKLPKATEAQAELEPRLLKAQSAHTDKAARFVYNALVSVVHSRISVEGWDDNDYAYIAVLAHALEDGALSLSTLVWEEERGWSKEKVFTANAVTAYIAQKSAHVKASGNEDEQADADNDHAYLRVVLKLDDPKNPFAA